MDLRVFSIGGRASVGVRVSPSSPRIGLKGLYGERLKIALSAPPEDNRANKQLEEAVAEWLGLAREQVRVETGHASRDKVVAFAGIDEAELRDRLQKLLRGPKGSDKGLIGGKRRSQEEAPKGA